MHNAFREFRKGSTAWPKILILDENGILQAKPEIEHAGEATGSAQALRAVRLRPDVGWRTWEAGRVYIEICRTGQKGGHTRSGY